MTSTIHNADWLEHLIDAHVPGGPLERIFYNSPEIFEREMEQIFFRHWLFVDHVSRIPEPGDYFLYEIGGESLIFVRGADREIRAFFNVCRHRGSRVCLEGQGHTKRFICPYHAWIYNLDGSLAHTRDHMPEGFKPSEYGLQPAHVRVMEGLIFVFMGQNPTADIDQMISEVQPFLEPHGWPTGKVCKRMRLVIQANWKLVAENSLECYHCGPSHPEFAAVMSLVGAMDSKRLAAECEELNRQFDARCASLGLKFGGFNHLPETWWSVRRLPIREGYLTQTEGGRPVAPLMGSYQAYDGGVTGFQIYPMNFLIGCSDHAAFNRFTPLDAQRTELEVFWLVDANAREDRDYDTEKVSWLWRLTGEADLRICEDNQKGVNSRRYVPGPYSRPESYVDKFIQLYLRQLRHGPQYEALLNPSESLLPK